MYDSEMLSSSGRHGFSALSRLFLVLQTAHFIVRRADLYAAGLFLPYDVCVCL